MLYTPTAHGSHERSTSIADIASYINDRKKMFLSQLSALQPGCGQLAQVSRRLDSSLFEHGEDADCTEDTEEMVSEDHFSHKAFQGNSSSPKITAHYSISEESSGGSISDEEELRRKYFEDSVDGNYISPQEEELVPYQNYNDNKENERNSLQADQEHQPDELPLPLISEESEDQEDDDCSPQDTAAAKTKPRLVSSRPTSNYYNATPVAFDRPDKQEIAPLTFRYSEKLSFRKVVALRSSFKQRVDPSIDTHSRIVKIKMRRVQLPLLPLAEKERCYHLSHLVMRDYTRQKLTHMLQPRAFISEQVLVRKLVRDSLLRSSK